MGATLHIQSLVRFEVAGNMHFVVVEGEEGVGNMHFVVVEGKEVVGIANFGDNWEHYYQIIVVVNHLHSINSCRNLVD